MTINKITNYDAETNNSDIEKIKNLRELNSLTLFVLICIRIKDPRSLKIMWHQANR